MLTVSADGKVVAKIGDFGVHAVLKEPKHSYQSHTPDTDNEMHPSVSGKASRVRSLFHGMAEHSWYIDGTQGNGESLLSSLWKNRIVDVCPLTALDLSHHFIL